VPCVVRWPGKIPAGTSSKAITSTIDVLPTLAHLAGARPPGDRKIDGKNIWPILSGQSAKAGTDAGHSAFYYYQMDQLQAVRSGPWKMFVAMKTKKRNWGKPEPAQPLKLFNLAKDIHEDRNVAAGNPDVVKRLMGLIETARADLGDTDRPGSGQRKAGWVAKASPRLLKTTAP
jgi:arylsulfatase A